MIIDMIYVFAIAVFLLLYGFLGYPLTVFFLGAIFSRKSKKCVSEALPKVMFVFAACFEGKKIKQKIDNCCMIDYPHEKLEIVAVSDAATAETVKALKKAESNGILKLLENPRRSGKGVALARALAGCKADVFVVTDADTLLDPDHLKELVAPFADPDAGVTTGIIHYANVDETGISRSQGLYWRFELLTRKAESLLGRLIGVTGAFYAIRPELFEPSDPRVDADFVAPLQALEKGKAVLLLNHLSAVDYSPSSTVSLLNRRTRMITLGLFSLFRNVRYLNPFRFPLLAFQLWTHKIVRWLLPFFMVAILVSSVVLALHGGWGWIILAILQGCFYLAGLMGGIANRVKLKIPLVSQLWYFLLSAWASVVAFLNLLRGRDYAVWQETARR